MVTQMNTRAQHPCEKKHYFFINPLTPLSDQDRICPYNVNTESSTQVRRIKKKN